MRSCEVLVSGAGPTGLMLANWLAKLGVDVLVADGKEGPTRESRALVVQARSLEIYDQLGLDVVGQAQRATALAPGFGARVFGRIALGAAGAGITPYPWIEILEQSRNEQILYANLRALGADVQWGAAVESLTSSSASGGGDGVLARVGGEEVRARYCVGADGANSIVRRSREIDFEGVTNPHRFYVIDATGVGGLVTNAINVRPGGSEFLIAFPMRGRGCWRLIGLIEDGDGVEETEETVRPRLKSNFAVTYGESRWFATYRVHHRVASRFRDGPFFLAGDAAHVHSPVGGQGMNTGLQDAHNLAFKLADALRGRAGETWLDRYEAERRPVAKKLVATTDRLFGLVTSQRLLPRLARRLVVPLAAPLGVRIAPRSPFFQYVSQIRIHYRLTPDAPRDPVVGRRLPWTGNNYAPLKTLQWQIHGYGASLPSSSPAAPAVSLPSSSSVAPVVSLPSSSSAAPAVSLPSSSSVAPGLSLPFFSFPAAPDTELRSDLLYLVRPDGFVAAAAPPSSALEEFSTRMGDLGLLV